MAYKKVSETVLGEDVVPAPYTANFDLVEIKQRKANAVAKIAELNELIAWCDKLLAEGVKLGVKDKVETVAEV